MRWKASVRQQHDVFNLRHVRHQNFPFSQIIHLTLRTAVAVHDSVTVQMMEAGKVVERTCGFDNLVAAAERLDGVFGEHQLVKFEIYAVGGIALHEQYRLAAAQKVDVYFLGQTSVEVEHLIVPGSFSGIETLDPDSGVVHTGSGEIDVVGIVNESTVGTHLLDGVPKCVHDAAVDKHARVVYHDDGVRTRVLHGAEVVKHRFFTVGQAQGIVFVVAALGCEEQLAALTQDFVFREDFLPPSHHIVQFGNRQTDLLAVERLRLEIQQLQKFVVQQQEQHFFKFGIGFGSKERRTFVRGIEKHVDRPLVLVFACFGENRPQRRHDKRPVAAIRNNLLAETCFTGTVGTDYGNLFYIFKHRCRSTVRPRRKFKVHVFRFISS